MSKDKTDKSSWSPFAFLSRFFVKSGGTVSIPDEPKLKKPKWIAEWEKATEGIEVGSTFSYLDSEMIVVGKRNYASARISYGVGPNFAPINPAIIAEYKDDHGVIHEKEFGLESFPIINIDYGPSINMPDEKAVSEILLEHSKQIVGIVEEAMNRRGRTGVFAEDQTPKDESIVSSTIDGKTQSRTKCEEDPE